MSLELQNRVRVLEQEVSALKLELQGVWKRFKDGEVKEEPIPIPPFPRVLKKLGYESPKELDG